MAYHEARNGITHSSEGYSDSAKSDFYRGRAEWQLAQEKNLQGINVPSFANSYTSDRPPVNENAGNYVNYGGGSGGSWGPSSYSGYSPGGAPPYRLPAGSRNNVAALLAFFIPGAGHLYLGEYLKAAVFFFSSVIALFLYLNTDAICLMPIILVSIWLIQLFDAARNGR
jgi:hypothetical protein